MQEIAPHVYVETGYAGVTLGAISWPHGLVLIDAPFKPEDCRSWRSALLNLGGGVDRLLLNLDAHYDRTLGARAMECTVVGQEKMSQVFRSRPITFKSQSPESGSEWELVNGLGTIRWAPPEITFSQQMVINWDNSPLVLEYHPGSATGATWAVLPQQKIIFVGDTVLADQPPFLASANLPEWIEAVKLLLSPDFRDYLFISGRGGLVVQAQVHDQLKYLENVSKHIETLAASQASAEETEKLVNGLMKPFKAAEDKEPLYRQRLRWGLYQYYARHYQPTSATTEE